LIHSPPGPTISSSSGHDMTIESLPHQTSCVGTRVLLVSNVVIDVLKVDRSDPELAAVSREAGDKLAAGRDGERARKVHC
jgi:hypothetical protein